MAGGMTVSAGSDSAGPDRAGPESAGPDSAGHGRSAVTQAATATAGTSAGPAAGGFTWRRARADLDGLPGGRGLNIAHEAVDRHADGPLAGHVALRCVARDDRVSELS